MGTQRLTERVTVRLTPEQLARFQAASERRGVEVSALVRQLALHQLESNPITPDEVKNIVSDAYEAAAVEILPQFEPSDAPLEDQLERLAATEADLRARRSRLQGQKTELARQRAEAMKAGDVDRATELAREIANLEAEIRTVEETLGALGGTRQELEELAQERDAAIRRRAQELLADALGKAADGVDVKLKELAAALDSLAVLWREVQPQGETFSEWHSRLAGHVWDMVARGAGTHEVRHLALQQPRPLLWQGGQPLAARLGVRPQKVLVDV